MEPVSVLLATGAAAALAIHRMERVLDRSRFGPRTLPEALGPAARADDPSTVAVLAVSLRSAALCPELAGRGLRARVKYGMRGESIACDSEAVQVPAASAACGSPGSTISADFHATSLFLEHRQLKPVIRLRLAQPGLLGRTLAKAEFTFAGVRRRAERPKEVELKLQGAGQLAGREVGTIVVTFSRYDVPTRALRRCLAAVNAQQQKEAFLAGGTPVDEGTLVGEEGEGDASGVVRGQPIYCALGGPGSSAVARA